MPKDLVFWESTADSFRRYIPLGPEPFVLACFCSVLLSSTGEGCWAVECWRLVILGFSSIQTARRFILPAFI